MDITLFDVDIIVNAANTFLMGGGGVDGAIHRVAGPDLLQECNSLGGCPTGEVVVTGAYRLCAKHIFHAVGPRFQRGNDKEEALLASCYRKCMGLCRDYEASSIVFPAISCGIYRFPPERAATIALREVYEALEQRPMEVYFSLPDPIVNVAFRIADLLYTT